MMNSKLRNLHKKKKKNVGSGARKKKSDQAKKWSVTVISGIKRHNPDFQALTKSKSPCGQTLICDKCLFKSREERNF